MDKTILGLVSLFDNSKNVIADFKNVYKRFRIIKEEKKFLYPYLSNILTNVRDVIDGKKIFLKNCGINIDDNYFIIIDNILENLNNIDNIVKKGGMKLSVNNDNMDLLNIVKITEGNDNYNKINIKNSTNSNNLSIKNIQLFFKNIYENFNKINNIKSFKEIKLTKFEINKNLGSIKALLQYFDKLLKRSDNEHNNNANINNYKQNIKNIKNSQKLFYDKIFINFLKNYKFLKKPYYEIDILRIINDFNLLTKLIYKFNNKLKKDGNFDIFNIYFKILYELFHINLANNNVVENKVFIFTIIIFVSNIISQFFNKINNQKIGETKMKKTFNYIIIYLFITSLFLISMIISILKLDKKKNNNQKGGILIETNDEYAFGHFMSNCKFEFFSKGTNGLIIVASLNEGVNSLYKYINLHNFGTQVKKLIIKLVFIYNEDDIKNNNLDTIFINDDYEFDQTSKQDFMYEVNVQTEIFLKTFEYLQPLCPAIVYSDIYNNENRNLFKNIFLKIDMFGKKLFAIILKKLGKEIKNIGLIAMEYAEDYKPIYKYASKSLDNMAKYLLIDLALKTGYTHSDFHTNNILLNINGSNYFKDKKGVPLIIDFGWAKKIPPSILSVIKKFYNDKKYNKILKIFCNLRRRNGKNLKNYEVFDWICRNECDDEKIEELIISRKLAIDDNVKLFEEKHEENNSYPLLPLSKKMRNSMYSGIFMNEK